MIFFIRQYNIYKRSFCKIFINFPLLYNPHVFCMLKKSVIFDFRQKKDVYPLILTWKTRILGPFECPSTLDLSFWKWRFSKKPDFCHKTLCLNFKNIRAPGFFTWIVRTSQQEHFLSNKKNFLIVLYKNMSHFIIIAKIG